MTLHQLVSSFKNFDSLPGLATYLHIFEQKRDIFTAPCNVDAAFVETFKYKGADPLGPVKTCFDYKNITIEQRR